MPLVSCADGILLTRTDSDVPLNRTGLVSPGGKGEVCKHGPVIAIVPTMPSLQNSSKNPRIFP